MRTTNRVGIIGLLIVAPLALSGCTGSLFDIDPDDTIDYNGERFNMEAINACVLLTQEQPASITGVRINSSTKITKGHGPSSGKEPAIYDYYGETRIHFSGIDDAVNTWHCRLESSPTKGEMSAKVEMVSPDAIRP